METKTQMIPTPNRVLAFGGYRCGCTMLLDSNTVRSIPSLCPEHGKGLLGNPTMEIVEPGIALGLELAQKTVHNSLSLKDIDK